MSEHVLVSKSFSKKDKKKKERHETRGFSPPTKSQAFCWHLKSPETFRYDGKHCNKASDDRKIRHKIILYEPQPATNSEKQQLNKEMVIPPPSIPSTTPAQRKEDQRQ
jgi:hypothetical protein